MRPHVGCTWDGSCRQGTGRVGRFSEALGVGGGGMRVGEGEGGWVREGGDGHGVGGGGRPKLHQEDSQAARPGPWRHSNVPWPRRCVNAAIHGAGAFGVHLPEGGFKKWASGAPPTLGMASEFASGTPKPPPIKAWCYLSVDGTAVVQLLKGHERAGVFDARWRRHDHRGDVTRFVRQKDHRSRPCQLHAAYRAWTAACRMDIGPTCGVLLLGGLPSIQRAWPATQGPPPTRRRTQ